MQENLSAKQQKLLEMLINGIPPKEIAHALNITYNTLLYHQKRLYRMLDVHSLYELIAKYAPNAKSETAIILTPDSGLTVQESLPRSSIPIEVQEDPASGGWPDKRFDGVDARRKTQPVKWHVIFGLLLFIIALFFFIIKLTNKAPVTDEGFRAVFNNWSSFKDEAGSIIDIKANPYELIDGKPFTTYSISGVLTGEEGWHWAGITLRPAPYTHQAMKKMTSFSFKVLGDGRSYRINIPTTDTLLIEELSMDHYSITIPTAKDQISIITINIDDLMQQGHGRQVPFIRDNILSMEFFAQGPIFTGSSETFYLKIWDIRIF